MPTARCVPGMLDGIAMKVLSVDGDGGELGKGDRVGGWEGRKGRRGEGRGGGGGGEGRGGGGGGEGGRGKQEGM